MRVVSTNQKQENIARVVSSQLLQATENEVEISYLTFEHTIYTTIFKTACRPDEDRGAV